QRFAECVRQRDCPVEVELSVLAAAVAALDSRLRQGAAQRGAGVARARTRPAGGSAADLSAESGNGHLRWLYGPPREPRDRHGSTRNPSTHGLGSEHRPSVLRQAQLSLSIVISEFRI